MNIEDVLTLEIPLKNVVVSFNSLSKAEAFVDWLMDEEDNEQGKGGKAIFEAWYETHKEIYEEM